jgi:hypothetical protein
VPLLQAELDEERRAHAERMTEWTDTRLKNEGLMLEDLGAGLVSPQPKLSDASVVYEFKQVGKGAAASRLPAQHKLRCVAFDVADPGVGRLSRFAGRVRSLTMSMPRGLSRTWRKSIRQTMRITRRCTTPRTGCLGPFIRMPPSMCASSSR